LQSQCTRMSAVFVLFSCIHPAANLICESVKCNFFASFSKPLPTQLNIVYANVGSQDLCHFSFVTADVRLIYVGRDNGSNSLNATVHLFGGPDPWMHNPAHSHLVIHWLTYQNIIFLAFHPYSPHVSERSYVCEEMLFSPLVVIHSSGSGPRAVVSQPVL
jgi:hypothetical protein